MKFTKIMLKSFVYEAKKSENARNSEFFFENEQYLVRKHPFSTQKFLFLSFVFSIFEVHFFEFSKIIFRRFKFRSFL